MKKENKPTSVTIDEVRELVEKISKEVLMESSVNVSNVLRYCVRFTAKEKGLL